MLLYIIKYYSSNTLNYTVRLQYYSVQQSTMPVIPYTIKNYSNINCNIKYYSSTTLY